MAVETDIDPRIATHAEALPALLRHLRQCFPEGVGQVWKIPLRRQEFRCFLVPLGRVTDNFWLTLGKVREAHFSDGQDDGLTVLFQHGDIEFPAVDKQLCKPFSTVTCHAVGDPFARRHDAVHDTTVIQAKRRVFPQGLDDPAVALAVSFAGSAERGGGRDAVQTHPPLGQQFL